MGFDMQRFGLPNDDFRDGWGARFSDAIWAGNIWGIIFGSHMWEKHSEMTRQPVPSMVQPRSICILRTCLWLFLCVLPTRFVAHCLPFFSLTFCVHRLTAHGGEGLVFPFPPTGIPCAFHVHVVL